MGEITRDQRDRIIIEVARLRDIVERLKAENIALKVALGKSVCGSCRSEKGRQVSLVGIDLGPCVTCRGTGHVQPEPVATGTGRVGGGGE